MFTACKLDPLKFDHPQDEKSDLYLKPFINIDLTSETDTSIAIELEIPEVVDKISIERNIITSVSGRDTSIYDFIFYIDVADYGNAIIDTNNIKLDITYEYIIRNVVGDDESGFIKDTITHILSIPVMDSVQQISATKAIISWTFNQNINDSLAFKEFMIKRQISSQLGADTTFTVSYDSSYVLKDNTIFPHIDYTYTVQAVTKSGNVTLPDSIDFHPIYPELADRDWMPLSLSDISIEYNFNMGNVQYEGYSLSVSRYRENQDPSEAVGIMSDTTTALSNLSFLDILVDPDIEEEWYYIVQWCNDNDSYCESDTDTITTLPFRYMVLVPGIDSYTYGKDENWEEAVSIDSFYISIYETPDSYYNDINQDLTVRITELANPEASANINWEDAVNYCSERTENILKSQLSGEGLRLPTKYEWEYAASFDEGSHERKYSFGDYMNSSLANYYLSEYGNVDAPLTVGYFNGINSGTQDAQSYLGLYDMNGNVMEWTSTQEQTSVYICKGGGFGNEGTDCNNTNEFTYSEVTTHKTIGFRPVISAKELLDYLKGKLE